MGRLTLHHPHSVCGAPSLGKLEAWSLLQGTGVWPTPQLLSWAGLGKVVSPLNWEQLDKVLFPLGPQGGAEHPIQEEKALNLVQNGVWQIPDTQEKGQPFFFFCLP